MQWLNARLRIFLEASHSPETAFTRNLAGPSFLIPLLVLGVAFTAITIAQAPLQLEWAQHKLESSGVPAAQLDSGLSSMRRSTAYAPVIIPVGLFVRWSLFALVLWLTAQILLDNLSYSNLLTIVSFSYVPILLRDATTHLILVLRREESVYQPDGLNVAVGANLLFPHIHMPWASLAGNINMFEVWFVTLLVVGISKAAPCRWTEALAVVLPGWLLTVLVQFGLAALNASFNP